jgi:hypothetical protein
LIAGIIILIIMAVDGSSSVVAAGLVGCFCYCRRGGGVQACLEFAVPSVHSTDFLVHTCFDARYLNPQDLLVLRGAPVPTRFSD